jgi:succinate dehydrogenase/fumarate reductase flavoprotein subunit
LQNGTGYVSILENITIQIITRRPRMHSDEHSKREAPSFDLIIVGSGAAGLAAAVTASANGLRVLILEKSAWFGGTTTSSAGVIWIPGSRQAQQIGIRDDPETVLRYLRSEAGDRLDTAKASAFADRAADVLGWFEKNSEARFALIPAWPDYHPDAPGGVPGGRSLGPFPFDGRRLGERFRQLRPPLATTMIFGGMIVPREDVGHFFMMTRSLASALRVARLTGRYLLDRVRWPRGTRLSNGSAVVGMLAYSAFARGVELRLNTPMHELLIENRRVAGVRLESAGGAQIVRARLGVILATGGFPASRELTSRYYDHVAHGKAHRTLAPADNTGDGIRSALAAGGAMLDSLHSPAAWTPVSLVPQPDGTSVPYPHFLDRGKAGYIAVNRKGERFIAEARSYHDFVPAMIEASGNEGDAKAWLICDAESIRRFGLGRAPPAPGRLGPHLRSGYLKQGGSIAALAAACGIDAAGLERTVGRFNESADRGEDPEFGKGGDVYQRFNGSPGVSPNPCVAPLRKPPFYAVELIPGCIGTFMGLKTDARSRVLDQDGTPLPGLWAVGNDAASFMGGRYPGAGITLGPALVFGHLAALDAQGSMATQSTSTEIPASS